MTSQEAIPVKNYSNVPSIMHPVARKETAVSNIALIQPLGITVVLILLMTMLVACGAPASGSATSGAPYGVDKRPQPAGEDIEVLIPRAVGSFTREAFVPGTMLSPDEDLNATYTSGDANISIGFGLLEDAAG